MSIALILALHNVTNRITKSYQNPLAALLSDSVKCAVKHRRKCKSASTHSTSSDTRIFRVRAEYGRTENAAARLRKRDLYCKYARKVRAIWVRLR